MYLLSMDDGIAFHLLGIPIRFYALCILIGALITLIVTQRIIKSYGYGKELIGDMFLYAFLGGLVGARLWYIVANIHEFLDNGNIFQIIWSMIAVWEGGLAVQGGVVLGTICGFWYLYRFYPDKKKYPKALIADAIIPNILIAQVAGRWGNFFNKEVYGKCVNTSDWEFLPEFIIDQMHVCGTNTLIAVPLFLIEGIINFIGWILITFVIRHFWVKRKDGYLSCLYFIWYGIVRLALEPLRDSKYNMSVTEGGIPTSMVMSALFVIGGILVMLLINHNAKRKDTYGQSDDPKKLLYSSIYTLSISKAYFAMKTAKYLSRDLDNNNYSLDAFMLAVCPFYGFKFYKIYGELCYLEFKRRGIEVEGLEEFKNTLQKKCYIPFAAAPYLAKFMNILYETPLATGEVKNG